MVQAQVVDEHHEHRRSIGLDQRGHLGLEELVRLQRQVVALAVHPVDVVVRHEAAEELVGLVPLRAQDLRHALVAALAQLQLPAHEFGVELLPRLGGVAVAQPHAQLTELLLVVAGGLLAHQPLAFEVLLQREQDLVRVHRLDQVVADLAADGALHDALLFALGDHHDGHGGAIQLDARERFEPAEAWHVLIQEDDVVFLGLGLFHSIEAVVHRVHGIAFLLQEKHVRAQQIDLVVGPKDVRGH